MNFLRSGEIDSQHGDRVAGLGVVGNESEHLRLLADDEARHRGAGAGAALNRDRPARGASGHAHRERRHRARQDLRQHTVEADVCHQLEPASAQRHRVADRTGARLEARDRRRACGTCPPCDGVARAEADHHQVDRVVAVEIGGLDRRSLIGTGVVDSREPERPVSVVNRDLLVGRADYTDRQHRRDVEMAVAVHVGNRKPPRVGAGQIAASGIQTAHTDEPEPLSRVLALHQFEPLRLGARDGAIHDAVTVEVRQPYRDRKTAGPEAID